jgi:hypothetical protein
MVLVVYLIQVVTVTTSGAAPVAPWGGRKSNQCKTSSGTFSVTPVTNAVKLHLEYNCDRLDGYSNSNGSSATDII